MDEAKRQSLNAARALLKSARTGTLSVLDAETGGPYGALINVAVADDGCPLILVSQLARHTQALMKDGRASIMVHAPLPMDRDPLTELRATVTGTFAVSKDAADRQSYLAHHPYAEGYADFGDFAFWRMTPGKIYVVAGFGRIYSFDL